MPRPKGSKNKPKVPAGVSASERMAQVDAELAGLNEKAEAIEAEIAEVSAQLSALRADLRGVKRDTKRLAAEKETLTVRVEAEEHARVAKEIVDMYLKDGKTVDDLKEALGI